MMFTLFRRWAVHVYRIQEKPEDCVAGALVITKEEFLSDDFQRIVNAKVFDMKDQIMRHAARKWFWPPRAA